MIFIENIEVIPVTLIDKNEKIIRSPDLVAEIFHPDRGLILNELIDRELTLRELADITKMNPGTVKRHLKRLLDSGVIQISKKVLNENGVKQIYYHATSENFIVQLDFKKQINDIINQKH